MNATKMLTASSKTICLKEKLNTVIKMPKFFFNKTLIITVATPTPIADKQKFIIAIMKLSAKKILNTSLLLEPIARRIPISCFLWEMLMPIKFASIKAAKTANPRPI